ILKASEAGVDVADAAIAAMSGTTSQPNLNSVVAALAHTERDTGLDLDALNQASDYWETVRTYYLPFDNAPRAGTAEVYVHEMPGGQYTNLKEQAESMGLGPRWNEIARAYADVNVAFGDIVKVTPSSKVVGDLALFLVSHGMTVKDLERAGPSHNLTLPNSVAEMLSGSLGEPDGGWPEAITNVVLRGEKPKPGRPGEHLAPVNLLETSAALEKKLGHKCSRTDLMSYLMYPDVFLKFSKSRSSYGDLDVLPTPQFFYGLDKGDETTVELEPGKALIVKFLAVSEPHPDGTRTIFFELNGQPREVTVRDRSLVASGPVRAKADPAKPGHVGAPIPGAVTSVAVELHETVK
ncbi:MAG: pyruvate carboxylase, partial [Bryobacteraceae bacterium]